MSLTGFNITPASEGKTDAMRVLLFGAPGSGKTYAASTIAQTGKTLYIDMIGERGEDSFRGTPWAKNIDIFRPKSITELSDLWKGLSKDETYKAVILDSLSAAQKSAMRHFLGYEEDSVSELRKGRSPATQQTWGQVLECMTDICVFWMSLADSNRKFPKHIVFTSQEKEHEDYEGNAKIYPDVSKGSRAIAMATPNLVAYTGFQETMSDEGEILLKRTLTVGPSRRYATKARIPHGVTVPDVLGLNGPIDLTALGKVLGSIK